MTRSWNMVWVPALGCGTPGGEGTGDETDASDTATEDTGDDRDTGSGDDTGADDSDTGADDSDIGGADPCADSLGNTSASAPYVVSAGTPVQAAATDAWDVFEFTRPTDDLFYVQLAAQDDVVIERRDRVFGGWTEVDADDIGSLPGGTPTLWKGWYDGVGSAEFFDTAVFDTDPTPLETMRIRVKSATEGECVSYTVETEADTGYACDPMNDISEFAAGASAALVDGRNDGIFDRTDPGSEEEDYFKDTIPAGMARQYVVRTIRDSARFGIANAQGLSFSGLIASREASPVVLVAGNEGTSATDVWFYAETLFGTPECLPYFVDVSTVPIPTNP